MYENFAILAGFVFIYSIASGGLERTPIDGALVGWFGPRGLARIVFAVIVLNEHLPGGGTIAMTVVCTIVLSVVAHGLSANPLIALLVALLKGSWEEMTNFTRFNHYFFHALSKVWGIFLGLFSWLVINAVAIAYFEKMPFADALYFTIVTGLTIGYGDIAPVTLAGRVVALLTGLLGILVTGLIVAIAVYALRETVEPPTDSH